MHLLRVPESQGMALGKAIQKLVTDIKYCQECHNFSDEDICEICSNSNRNHQIVCVVEDIRDVMAIENTGQYKGIYHVLGGKISPMEGIGPSQLNIESLIEKVKKQSVEEIILALSSTMEADTTNFYIAIYNEETDMITTPVFVDDIEVVEEFSAKNSLTGYVIKSKKPPFQVVFKNIII